MPADLFDLDQIVAITHPDIGAVAAVDRHRAVIDLLPLIERRGRAADDAVVEAERNDRDAEARDEQRREDLVRRQSRCFQRDDFAVLVERRQRDDRAEQHREGQEGRDDLGDAQRQVARDLGLAIAGVRQDVAALAQQVERLEHEHEHREHREGADQEHLAHVERHGARREQFERDHALAPLSRRPGSSLRIDFASFEKTRSSAPIGCPPGT